MTWPVLLNAEKALGRLASADSHLPFQDWRWLVTRPETEGKRVVCAGVQVAILRPLDLHPSPW
ncbi:hypothetical protein MPLDJ20_140412 [Mesorhizobium plurifarium]|uniref:Uncharacterized protein n=1 Tax=Mesorhizobium plurifarium TaxID=69974 RepID=A0A090ERM4_MESPL|nr:hypothetical protein MPLDJ20_140412 [Mesorhizobium plurifarium]